MTNRRTTGYCSDLQLQEPSLQINSSDLTHSHVIILHALQSSSGGR